MPNTKYLSGRQREYQIKHFLESKGFMVIRSAGSKSKVDLVAIRDKHLYLIQSKKGNTLSVNARVNIEKTMPKSGYRYVTSIALDDKWKEFLKEI